MNKLILFVIRRRFGLKKNEYFWFDGQKSDALYFFTDKKLMKFFEGKLTESNVKLNWLLNDECKINGTGAVYYE